MTLEESESSGRGDEPRLGVGVEKGIWSRHLHILPMLGTPEPLLPNDSSETSHSRIEM